MPHKFFFLFFFLESAQPSYSITLSWRLEQVEMARSSSLWSTLLAAVSKKILMMPFHALARLYRPMEYLSDVHLFIYLHRDSLSLKKTYFFADNSHFFLIDCFSSLPILAQITTATLIAIPTSKSVLTMRPIIPTVVVGWLACKRGRFIMPKLPSAPTTPFNSPSLAQ